MRRRLITVCVCVRTATVKKITALSALNGDRIQVGPHGRGAICGNLRPMR